MAGPVYSEAMEQVHSGHGGRVLIYEPDGLVCERVRPLLRAERLETCAVDAAGLFHRVRRELAFDLFVAGVRSPGELAVLELDEVRPLLVLAPLGEEDATHYRVALADAALVDRELRDPDAFRSAVGLALGRAVERTRPLEPRSASGDPVRQTFEPFGLSERQLEVLRRALLGESSGEIARRLFISEVTTKNHLHAIYERVGVSGRRELLGRFVRALVPEAGDSPPPPARPGSAAEA